MARRSALQIRGIFAFLVIDRAVSRGSVYDLPLVDPHGDEPDWRVSGGDLTNYLPVRDKNLYAVEYVFGRPHTIFPIGVSVLAAPFVGDDPALINPSYKATLWDKVPLP